MTEPAALAAAAGVLEPLVPAQRQAALRNAVARVAQGHARVLVLGEAKRGRNGLGQRLQHRRSPAGIVHSRCCGVGGGS